MQLLKKKDGSWNVPLIMALVVAVLGVLGGGYAVYYSLTRPTTNWRASVDSVSEGSGSERLFRDTRFDDMPESGSVAQRMARDALDPYVDEIYKKRDNRELDLTGEDIAREIGALNKYRGLLEIVAGSPTRFGGTSFEPSSRSYSFEPSSSSSPVARTAFV